MKRHLISVAGPRRVASLTLVGLLLGASPLGLPQDSPAMAQLTPSTTQRASWSETHVTTTVIPTPSGSVTASNTPTVITQGTLEQRTLVEEVLESFTDAGMALPDLVIRFSDDKAPCKGHQGLFRPATWTIYICSQLPFVLPHELGHAWERANLSDASRATYMEANEFEFWQEGTTVRDDQAIEDVAFVIQLVMLGGGSSGRPRVDQSFDLLMGLATA